MKIFPGESIESPTKARYELVLMPLPSGPQFLDKWEEKTGLWKTDGRLRTLFGGLLCK